MSKNTTDLKLKIEHYLVSTQQDGAGIAMGRRSTDGSLYKSRIDEFTEAIMAEVEQLISNREKLAVLKALREDRLHNTEFWQDRINKMFDRETMIYRKELDRED